MHVSQQMTKPEREKDIKTTSNSDDDGSLCGCGPCGPNNIERSIS